MEKFNQEEFDKEMCEAKKRVEYMDKSDGWKDRLPSTIWSALKCGIINKDSKAEFDALVMLEEIANGKI